MKPLVSIRALCLAALLAAFSPLHGQVVIHEFMSSNRSTTADEDWDYEDWIELKNLGATPVNLDGWGLSDSVSAPFKWTFPSRTIAPGEHLVVWASGKDRKNSVEQTGLLREVYFDTVGGSVETLEACGNFPAFPDSTNLMTGGFDVPRNVADNYGQRVSGWLTPQVSGNYEFWISGDNGCRLYLSSDDDPARAVAIASIPADRWSDPETYTTFASQYSGVIPLTAGKRYFMAALMKEDFGGDHMTVRWRRGNNNNTREIIPAARFTVKPAVLHTNFKISASGETLLLTRPDGSAADEVPPVALAEGVSYGRTAADPATWAYFPSPTRGTANTTQAFEGALAGKPLFSQSSGFFDSQFSLSLGSGTEDASIIYTLDGSIPDPANIGGKTYIYRNSYPNGSNLTGGFATLDYTGPIPIQDRSSQANKLSQRTTTYWSGSGYTPVGPVYKGTVVRARLVKPGMLPGPVETHTYFVGPGAANRYPLPVISLSIDEDDLFGYQNGLYTAGVDYDNWRAYSTFEGNGGTPANYKRRGSLSEHPVHFEMFLPQQGRVVSRDLGFRMHGGWSRAWPQKSLRFYADGYSEGDKVGYPLIPGRTATGTGQPIHAYTRFVLRNSGNDHELTRFRDAFIQELMKPLRLDGQGYQPAVHFINGEYWGLINIRERIDRHFIASHHGVDPDKVAILSNNAEISEGTAQDRADFIALRNFIAGNAMSNPSNYAYVVERMDVENFIRYNVAQIYANNRDWPHNNIDAWRLTLENPSSSIQGSADGRWRWVLFDMDFGFNLNGGPDTNTLAHATRHAGGQDWSTVMLRTLLNNTTFRNKFINTFADHMATSFTTPRVNDLADSMRAELAPCYAEHAARWRNSGSTSATPLKNFGSARPAHMRSHLVSHFGLSGTANLTLHTPAAAKGHLEINGMAIDSSTPGIANPSQPYPWTGLYFQGVPVEVKAVPAAGYRFAGWTELPSETSAAVTVLPGVVPQLTALFEAAPEDVLIHYWNFNVPATQLAASHSLVPGAAIAVDPGPLTVVQSGTGQDFSGENARHDDPVGAHLRINDPLGAAVTFALPTVGYENIVMRYETRRSAQGAGAQSVSYSLDGSSFEPLQTISVLETPVLHTFDFSAIPGADDNPAFKVRIEFSQAGGGISGNNRWDNVTLEGWAIPNANQPPQVVRDEIRLAVTEDGGTATVDLTGWFDDPDGDALSFHVSNAGGTFAHATLEGGQLTVTGVRRGEAALSVTASDGLLSSFPANAVVLVHPAAHALASQPYQFGSWDADEPEFAYPEHGLFVQSEINDPGAADPLPRAYSVGTDHVEADSGGFPYNNVQRTRINGLGQDGISFINTGRGRDLGGFVVALDTTGVHGALVGFDVQTRAVNFRQYAIRLQCRAGTDGEFADVLHEGQPVAYLNETDAGGPATRFEVELPPGLLDLPYVQLMWRYHHVDGASGSRAEIRLDDIDIIPIAAPPDGFALWRQEQFPDPADLDDPDVSGPHADPLGIGVGNLLRYALGIASPVDHASRMPRLVRSPDDSLTFRFPFDPALTDIRVLVEASPDLIDWSERLFESSRDHTPEPDADGWIAIDDLDSRPGAAASGYFRLRVELGHE